MTDDLLDKISIAIAEAAVQVIRSYESTHGNMEIGDQLKIASMVYFRLMDANLKEMQDQGMSDSEIAGLSGVLVRALVLEKLARQ